MKILMLTYLRDIGLDHEVMYTDIDQIAVKGLERVVKEIKDFGPDLIIEEENNDGKSIYSSLFSRLEGIQKAWWMVDAHTDLVSHLNYAKQFDYVFCAQSWFIPMAQRETLAKVFYLPLCHTQTDEEYRKLIATPRNKDIDFSFIGNIRSIHVERKRYVRKFLEMFGEKFFARKSNHDDTLEYLMRSKMTFNCSLNNDLNKRVWEAVACGCQVLTDVVADIRVCGLSRYCTLYDKLIPDWSVMQHPVESYGNFDFILARHTFTKRFGQMIKMIETGEQEDYA
jgi:hypothetical protein